MLRHCKKHKLRLVVLSGLLVRLVYISHLQERTNKLFLPTIQVIRFSRAGRSFLLYLRLERIQRLNRSCPILLYLLVEILNIGSLVIVNDSESSCFMWLQEWICSDQMNPAKGHPPQYHVIALKLFFSNYLYYEAGYYDSPSENEGHDFISHIPSIFAPFG